MLLTGNDSACLARRLHYKLGINRLYGMDIYNTRANTLLLKHFACKERKMHHISRRYNGKVASLTHYNTLSYFELIVFHFGREVRNCKSSKAHIYRSLHLNCRLNRKIAFICV